jgi:hypothetical protein
LSKKPELGGAVVSARTKVHYLEFTMAASVQGWKKKMVLHQRPEKLFF